MEVKDRFKTLYGIPLGRKINQFILTPKRSNIGPDAITSGPTASRPVIDANFHNRQDEGECVVN